MRFIECELFVLLTSRTNGRTQEKSNKKYLQSHGVKAHVKLATPSTHIHSFGSASATAEVLVFINYDCQRHN